MEKAQVRNFEGIWGAEIEGPAFWGGAVVGVLVAPLGSDGGVIPS